MSGPLTCYMGHHSLSLSLSLSSRLTVYENTHRRPHIVQILTAVFKCQFTD
jgi:hypothetical protein